MKTPKIVLNQNDIDKILSLTDLEAGFFIKSIINSKKIVNPIIYPFNTLSFKNQWIIWKEYKKEEHNFKYKSFKTEQAALDKIKELSNNNEKIAIAIIKQSIENGWKGLFKYSITINQQLKNDTIPVIGRMNQETLLQNLNFNPIKL